ncbi:hypothetical protein J8L86_07820 [Shewanella sp. MMG014]|nr:MULTISPECIES: hypothetical protein [unclassified Shewanella]MBQ4889749.1 hypothetical protein [Shewanella sp. MMG014]
MSIHSMALNDHNVRTKNVTTFCNLNTAEYAYASFNKHQDDSDVTI